MGEPLVSAMTDILDENLRVADETLARFLDDLHRDPAHAFEWSISAFEAAATVRVFGKVRELIAKQTTEAVRATAQRTVVLLAKRGSKSTSESANLMMAEIMSAWARVLEILQYTEGGR